MENNGSFLVHIWAGAFPPYAPTSREKVTLPR